ncbi:MAG: helix-turn-helix domain-containing protein [Oscillospiraceae bacterium]
MEFYQKLQALRKEKAISQEELAERLNVSRQAVSRWENGQGYPETEKLLQISQLFSVSLDYLLKSEPPEKSTAEGIAAPVGYYASREMVEGYLSFKQQGATRIACGVAVLILSLLFPILLNRDFGSVLFLLGAAMGVAILVSLIFRQNDYSLLESQPLIFDPAFLRDFSGKYALIRKRSGFFITFGIISIIVGLALTALTDAYIPDFSGAFFVLFTALGVFSIIRGGSKLLSANVIAKNKEHIAEEQHDSRYGWIYGFIVPLGVFAMIACGMLWGSWRLSWIFVPVAALLASGIASFLKYRDR